MKKKQIADLPDLPSKGPVEIAKYCRSELR
jgi:hypothetical protein